MKFSAILIATLMSSSAFAAAIPNCWSESGVDLVDGQFLVHLDTEFMSKDDMYRALSLSNGRTIHADAFPAINGGQIRIIIDAADRFINKMSRADLQAKATTELTELAKIPGVSVTCNEIIRVDPPTPE